MSDTATNGINLLDPLGLWKTARDANLDAWAKMMNIVVNSDEYAQMTGAALEQSLAASQPFRDSLAKVMTQMQGMMNMPTRGEVISLAERLINLELRLDDMDAKLSAAQASIEESTRDAVRQALATPARHIRELDTRFDTLDAQINAMDGKLSATQTSIEESTRDAVRQALATPARHIRELETRFDALGAQINALPAAVQEAVREAMAPAPPPAPPAPRSPKEKAQEAQS